MYCLPSQRRRLADRRLGTRTRRRRRCREGNRWGRHPRLRHRLQGCQMAKFDPFLSLDFARVDWVEGAIQGKEGSNFAV